MARAGTDTSVAAIETGSAASLEWSPVFAGAVLAAALSFVLLTFGTAIGLSATSPWPHSGLPARVIAGLAVFWAMAQQIGAFLAGGYVAGRMRSQWTGPRTDEIDFRDGLHGALVWALGIVIGAALMMAAGSALARVGAEVGGKGAASLTSTTDPMDLAVDAMLRQTSGGVAQGRKEFSARDDREAHAELSRILTTSIANGSLSDQNRAYLTQRIAQATALSQSEAETRVNEALRDVRAAADKARRAAVLTGLVTAVSLMVSLGAAWWAAVKGGRHRDNATPPTFALNQRWRRPTA
jgi:hypothetical protein